MGGGRRGRHNDVSIDDDDADVGVVSSVDDANNDDGGGGGGGQVVVVVMMMSVTMMTMLTLMSSVALTTKTMITISGGDADEEDGERRPVNGDGGEGEDVVDDGNALQILRQTTGRQTQPPLVPHLAQQSSNTTPATSR